MNTTHITVVLLMLLIVLGKYDSCDVVLTTNRTIVELGSTVAMTCKLCPDDNDVVKINLNGEQVIDYWKPSGQPVVDSSYSVIVDILNNITHIYLTVLSFTIDKAGTYTCLIGNTQNESSITLLYAVPVYFVDMKPKDMTVSLLNNVTTNIFCCTSSIGRPTPVIRWYTDNRTPRYYGDDLDITILASNSTNSSGSGETTTSQLTFIPSTFYHGQKIYCNVSNGYGQILSNSTPLLEILHPVSTPTIYYVGPGKEIDKITVIRGQFVPLQCNSSSNPPPTYVWSIEGEIIAQGAFYNQPVETDSVVICNASNCMIPTGNTKVCSSRLAYMNLTTYFPPEKPVLRLRTCGSSVVSTSTIKVIEGHSVDVLCTSVSNPEPTYFWNSSMSIPGNVLTLKNVTASQNASYSCTALNIMNTTFNDVTKGTNTSVFYLEVLVPPRVQQMENLTALLNTNLSVVCPFTVGNPPSTTIEWIRENMTRSLGPILSITGIKLADEGTYICAASNTMEPTNCNSQKCYTRNSLHLDVQYAAKITKYFANDFENQNVITVTEYENIKLECVFDSDPVANITIVNGTRMLESGKTNTLIASIPHARCEYDATFYRCQGGNKHSTETQERVLEVFIKCAPRPSPFYPPVTNISRTLNGSAVLTFTIKAYPKPDISAYSWYRLIGATWEIITDVNSVHKSVSADGLQTNLSIPRLQIDDFGRYRVRVFNELGNATQEYELRAHDKPETPKNLHVKEGSLGVDSFTVEWEPGYHGGEDQTFVILYKAKQSTLQWTDVNVSSNNLSYSMVGLQSGTTYLIKMFAKNMVGNSEETDVLTAITISKPEPQVGNQLTAGIVGGSVSVILAAVIILLIVIVRKRRIKESAKQNPRYPSTQRLKQPQHGSPAVEHIDMAYTAQPKTAPREKTVNKEHKAETKSIEKDATEGAHVNPKLKKTNSFAIERDPVYDNLIKERRNLKSRDISIKHFRKSVTHAKDDPTEVFIEFSNLTAESEKIKYSTDAARRSVNISKSRYKNMFPYDKNRVLLPIIDCDEDSDFINASFIDGYSCERKYIAAQGPLASTIADTWRMIWAENISVVAMVTNLVEDSKRKCFQYWPDNVSETCQYDDFSVSMLTKNEYADFIVRKLQCSKKGSIDIHTVTHCHFTAWPDKNVPDTALSLLQFWRKVRSVGSEDNAPWMVHCSAGVGRTGTFIAIDYLYDQGTAEQQVNLFDAIIKLREQRINMVQTKLQYLYLHEVACEALCQVGDILTKNVYIGSIKPNDFLHKEFEILEHANFPDFLDTHAEDDYVKILDGEKPENKQKNIDPAVVPDDKYRPVLNLFVHVKGHNDYINAVYISTYLEQDKLILTQSVPAGSEIDFVRLLHDHYVNTIVSFCDQVDSVVPVNDNVLVIGPFAATLISNSATEHYRDSSVVYKRIGEQQGFEVRVLQFTKWPQNAHVCDAEDLVNFVINVQKCANEGPVVIQCHDGYTQSGLFAVIWCTVERLKREGDVALAETVRMIRKRRKQIITNATQYSFCHECAKHFIKGCDDYVNV